MSTITADEYNRKILQKILQEWCSDLQLETRKDGIALSRDSLQLIEKASSAVMSWEEWSQSGQDSVVGIKLELPESTIRLYLIGTVVRDEILPNLSSRYLKLKEIKKRTRRGAGGSWKIKVPVIEEKLVERKLKEAFKTKIKYKKDDKLLMDLKKELARLNGTKDEESINVREALDSWNIIVVSPSSPLYEFLKPLFKLNNKIKSTESQIRTLEATKAYHEAEVRRLREEKRSLEGTRDDLSQALAQHPLKQELNLLEDEITKILKDSEVQHFLKMVHHVVHAHLREIEYGRAKPTKFVKELQEWHDDDSSGFSEELIKHWAPLVEYMLINAEESLKSMRWFAEEYGLSLTEFQLHLTKSDMARRFLHLQQLLARKQSLHRKLDALEETSELRQVTAKLERIHREIVNHEEKIKALADKKARLLQERELLLKQLREASSSRV